MSVDALAFTPQGDGWSADFAGELLANLHELLEDSSASPGMQTRIQQLIVWVEAQIAGMLDDDAEVEVGFGTPHVDEFSLLAVQAQQQEQQ
jgi:hypothetical protein